MVVQVTPNDVIAYSRSVLGVEDDSNLIDDALLVALLRRLRRDKLPVLPGSTECSSFR